MSSFMWNLFGLDGLNCKNLTLPGLGKEYSIIKIILNGRTKLKISVIFKKMVYLTLNAHVLSSTAKNSDGVYLSLKLFWHIVTRGLTLARGSWFGLNC